MVTNDKMVLMKAIRFNIKYLVFSCGRKTTENNSKGTNTRI